MTYPYVNPVHSANERLLNTLFKNLEAIILEAERGLYRGGFEVRATFDEKGKVRGVHLNNRLIQIEDEKP